MAEGRATALVTGASGGIGEALARSLASRGYDLVLVARSEERLGGIAAEIERGHGVRVVVLAADLAEPHAAQALVARLERLGLAIEVLVNNAGLGAWGPFAALEPERNRAMIALNVTAPTELCRLLLPGMMARGHGRILNVASTAAFQPGPRMAVYYATKAYLLHLSEALASELAGSGVTVTALCPGPTRSGFQSAAGMAGVRLVEQRGLLMDAGAVAEAGIAGLEAGRRVVIPGLANKLGVFLNRLAPRALSAWLVGRLQSRRA